MSTAPQLVEAETLDGEIEEALRSGLADPHEIARRMISRHDASWLVGQLMGKAESFLAWHVRMRVGEIRRSFVRAVPHEARTKRYRRSFLDVPVYLGEAGWKAAGDMTAHDARACASLYRERIEQLESWASFWEAAASLIEAQSVSVLREADGWEVLL